MSKLLSYLILFLLTSSNRGDLDGDNVPHTRGHVDNNYGGKKGRH